MTADPATIKELLRRACDEHDGQTGLGKKCGVSQNAIWAAAKAGRVSASLAVKLEAVTGIARSTWRPDLWQPVETEKAA